jgi:uncharacterized caspase-like protein
MKIFLTTILILLFSCNLLAQRGIGITTKTGKNVILYENSYALIIGNSEYQKGGWGNLPGVKDDITAVNEILCQHGFKVEIAKNLTSDNFKVRIEKFIKDYGKAANNRILLYYAGHGYKRKSNGDSREIGYVVPVDAPNPDQFEFVNYAVTMDTIENYAKEIQSKHALFVFDNCFSGKLVNRNPIVVPSEINEQIGGAVRQFLTSGSSEQEVPDESNFRRLFVRGLKGEADQNGDGYTTTTELAFFIQAQLKNTPQSPQYGKINDPNLNQGDFTFAKPNPKADCPPEPKTNEEDNNYSSNLPLPRTVESNFFQFNLKSCGVSGTLLTCRVAVKNLEVDREIGFGSKTKVYDDLGNEYPAAKVSIGIKSGATVYATINNGVTAEIQLTFSGWSPNANKISKFEIFVASRKSADFKVEYRDISLGRTNPRPKQPVGQRLEQNRFIFELNGCKKSGSQVFCDLTVTNNDVDREIGLGSQTKLSDDLGNTYSARQVSVALKNGVSVYADFISKVPVKVRFTFENVALESNVIHNLNILVVQRGQRRFNVNFDNIRLN